MMAALAPLRHASREFLARWKVAERKSATEARHMEGVIALFVCGLIVLTGWLGDAQIAASARATPEGWQSFFQRVTKLGESGWIFALCTCIVALALLLRHRGFGARMDAALGLLAGRAFFIIFVNATAGLLSLGLKSLIGRARPRLFDVVGPFHFDLFSIKSAVLSFPSGHSVTAFATATALAFLAPRAGRWALGLAVLIGISRVVTGAHYPSDVIAGMALGTATCIFARRAFAARAIVFRHADTGIILRGAGLVGWAMRQAVFIWRARASRTGSRSLS